MTTIFRNFWTTLRRFKLASALNIIGLSVAFAAFMVIMMQVRYDRTFDQNYPDADRLYCVASMSTQTEGFVYVSRAAFDTYTTLSPGIEQATLVAPPWSTSYIQIEKEGALTGFVDNIQYAYGSFAEMFGLEFIDGANTLGTPDKAIIPKSLAIKFFGTPYAVGKTIDAKTNLTVGGVFNDLPDNSQLRNTIYIQLPEDENKGQWGNSNYLMFVKLKPGYTIEQVHADFKKFDQKSAFDYITTLQLTPLEEVYFDTREYYGDSAQAKKGDRNTSNIMFAISLLIVVIAAINFVNFSTSLAPLRMKSINTQKVFGCPTSTLRVALIVEAAGISILAYIASLIWVYALSQSALSDIIIAGISITHNPDIVGWSALLAVGIGLVAGIYPALYTTKFPPALVLKGSFAMSPKGRALRMGLIGFQFVISIGLIIFALFMQLQNRYMQDMDTGINRNRIAVIQIGGEIQKQQDVFSDKLRESPMIEDVAYSQFKIGGDNQCQGWSRDINGESQQFDALTVSWNFPQVMGIKLLAGEMFEHSETDKPVHSTFLFNEMAAKAFKITDFPIQIHEWDSVYSDVKGIVKDFNFRSLQQGISRTALVVVGTKGWNNSLPYGYVKITGDPAAAVSHIRQTAASIDPAYPISIEFYDDIFKNLYKAEIKTTQLISLASVLAVIIALVGVFGLVVFETQYRRKEIGVRKVHGSTVMEILVMFNRKFVWIVVICFVIATPLTYLAINEWLDGFAYRTPIHWWVFGCGLLIVLCITLFTVTIQSYRTATENPVKSIKSE